MVRCSNALQELSDLDHSALAQSLLSRPLQRAEHALFTVIRACPLPSLLTPLATASRDANPKLRRAVCSATTLTVVHWKAGGRADEVEGMIKVLAEDRDEGVRKAARELWDKYKVTWPERVPACVLTSPREISHAVETVSLGLTWYLFSSAASSPRVQLYRPSLARDQEAARYQRDRQLSSPRALSFHPQHHSERKHEQRELTLYNVAISCCGHRRWRRSPLSAAAGACQEDGRKKLHCSPESGTGAAGFGGESGSGSSYRRRRSRLEKYFARGTESFKSYATVGGTDALGR